MGKKMKKLESIDDDLGGVATLAKTIAEEIPAEKAADENDKLPKTHRVVIGVDGRPVFSALPTNRQGVVFGDRAWSIGTYGAGHEAVAVNVNTYLHQYLTAAANQIIGFHATPRGALWSMDIFVKNYDAFVEYFDENRSSMGRAAGEMEELLEQCGMVRAYYVKRVAADTARGVIAYEDLGFYFTRGDKVFGLSRAGTIGGKLLSVEYQTTYSGQRFLICTIEVIHQYNMVVSKGQAALIIGGYSGEREISSLSVQKIDDETMASLSERGAVFRKFTEGNEGAYVNVKRGGQITVRSYWGDRTFRAEGRAMIDVKMGMRVANAQVERISEFLLANDRTARRDNEREITKAKPYVISDDELFMCMPTLIGFSMTSKMWGEFAVSDLEEIQWRDDAFDLLVLDEDLKDQIKALVQHHGDGFEDIISGKGGGVIFLLHGVPGVGKTLTAETVAELLHRPLYSVSVGELGTNPENLEESLRQILDVASGWDAVLLLDEADIFLEARDEHDILRNAMVGVFLRLLEYHQGVMFLTTNRVRNIDRAFYSRISIGIKFDGADDEKRKKIWRNLAGAAKFDLTEEELDKLAQIDVNGRQIKNVLRQSRTLAKAKAINAGSEVYKPTYDDLEKIIAMVQKFERDVDLG